MLDDLERRITAALQVDGRAPWRKIAAVLGEPERTVARRGADLLASGLVNVIGLQVRTDAALLRLECLPGTARVAAESMAQRKDSTFSYLMTGGADCVAEVTVETGQLNSILASEIPATIGETRVLSYPVAQYFRSIRGWRAGVLTEAQEAALSSEYTADHPSLAGSGHEPLSVQDARIVQVLVGDGRATIESIARQAGISETTASRRTEWLLRNNRLQIRTVVEPAAVGLPVEALLWMRIAPDRVERVGRELARLRPVRYAAALIGDYQIVADVTMPDSQALYRFITESPWAREVEAIHSTMLLQARKRGGWLLPLP